MGTRAIIANTTHCQYEAIYLHYDGYPAHCGEILANHYDTPQRVADLIALGHLSSIGPNLAAPADVVHDFDNPARDVCVAYGRDRGEENQEAMRFATMLDLLCYAAISGTEFIYVREGDTWRYSEVEPTPDRFKFYPLMKQSAASEKAIKGQSETLTTLARLCLTATDKIDAMRKDIAKLEARLLTAREDLRSQMDNMRLEKVVIPGETPDEAIVVTRRANHSLTVDRATVL